MFNVTFHARRFGFPSRYDIYGGELWYWNPIGQHRWSDRLPGAASDARLSATYVALLAVVCTGDRHLDDFRTSQVGLANM